MNKKLMVGFFMVILIVLGLFAGLAGSQPKEIIVGAPCSLTGGYGESGRQAIAGLQMAVDEINSRGGIKALGGARIKLIVADTSTDNPSQAASVTRRTIIQDKAIILVGSVTSTMTLAAQVEAEKEKVPILANSSADAIVQRGYKYTFKVNPNSSSYGEAAVQYIPDMYKKYKGTPLKRVAVFYGTDAANQGTGKGALESVKKRGLDVVVSGTFPSGLTDPTPIVGPVNREKPEVLFFYGFPNDVILVTRALRGLGVQIPIVGAGGGISAKLIGEALGKVANGVMGTVSWNWDIAIEGVSEFDKRYKVTYPNEPFTPEFSGGGYAIGLFIKEVFERAKSYDSKVIRDTLASIDVPSILSGKRIAFDENGLNKYVIPVMIGWIDGELRTVWPEEYKARDPFIR